MDDVFEIWDRVSGTTPVVAVRGEIDVATAPELRNRLLEASQAGHSTVVVDLSEVSFLDSTALGVLVGSLKRLRAAGGDLPLVVTGRSVTKVLEITGLADVFSVFDTVSDATESTAEA
jgi:anti-sigma B factor antagonist